MRNLLTACLPALALFALGGCAGTSALTSSEDDGVYYSSKDRTTAIVSTAPAQAPAANSEEANPDYNGGSTTSPSARQNSGSDQYYDNTYTYMRGASGYGGSSNYYGAGLNTYSPYSPYTSLSYGGGGYGYGGYGGGYGGYDPFYSSRYSPYGFGSGLNISFGFGRSFGYGGYGGYSPFGYGYGGYGGYGGYDPFYYSSPFYGGYYGRSYYGGGGYYGNNYNGGGYYGNGGDQGTRNYGSHRTDRASDGRHSSDMVGSTPGNLNPAAPNGSGRVRSDGVMSNTPGAVPMSTADAAGRTRSEATTQPMRANDSYNQPRNMDAQPRYRNMEPATNMQPAMGAASEQGRVMRDDGRGRARNMEAQPQNSGQMQPAAVPQDGQRRRGGFFQNVFGEPSNNNGQAAEQSRQRSYDQPRQQRAYEQPQQRSYQQPQQRSYEQPQQRSYSQPSYSSPSQGGGGGGGGGRGRGRGE